VVATVDALAEHPAIIIIRLVPVGCVKILLTTSKEQNMQYCPVKCSKAAVVNFFAPQE